MRHVVIMASSSSIGLVSIFLVDAVDFWMISQLGNEKLTSAITFAAALLYLTFSLTLGLTIANGALVARLLGMDKDEGAREIATSALAFGQIISVVTAATFWLVAPDLLHMLGARDETLEHATSYFRIVIFAMPISTFGLMCSSILRAHGDAGRAMMVTLCAGAVNFVLDLIFIFGFGWGLEGAAMASVGARIATLMVALVPIYRHYGGLAPFHPSRFVPDLKPILGLALPAMLTNAATPIGGIIVTRIIAPYGDDVVAAFGAIGRMVPLFFCVIFAISGAVGPIIGQNFGAKNFDRVRGTILAGVKFAALYTMGAWLLFGVLNGYLADWFNLKEEGRRVIFWFAVAVAPLWVFNGMLFISNASFNNLKRPLWSSYMNWGKNTLGLAPFAYAGAHWLGPEGALIGQGIGGILFGLLGLFLALKLVDDYESGKADPDRPSGPSLMRRREDAPMSSPRP